jgi:hypothetical protein
LLLGLLTAVQQQRGVPLAAGIFVWLVVDRFVQRRFTDAPPSTPLVPQLAWLVTGALGILIPLGIVLIASCGIGPLWFALVVFPLFNYRQTIHCPWGEVNLMSLQQSTFTFPLVLKYLPLIFLVMVPRLLYRVWQANGAAEAARLTLLTLYCLTSIASIFYFPDFIHIAFIASAFFISIAESAEWAVARIRIPHWFRLGFAVGATAVVLFAAGQHLQRNLTRSRAAFPISHATAFGRIDFANQEEIQLYEQVMTLLADAPSRDLYVYPILSDLYLTADAHNPTPYGFFSALGHNGLEQIQHVLRILAQRPPPYVVVLSGILHVEDPIIAYIQQQYTLVWAPPKAPRVIFRRNEPKT